eukprot:791331_1
MTFQSQLQEIIGTDFFNMLSLCIVSVICCICIPCTVMQLKVSPDSIESHTYGASLGRRGVSVHPDVLSTSNAQAILDRHNVIRNEVASRSFASIRTEFNLPSATDMNQQIRKEEHQPESRIHHVFNPFQAGDSTNDDKTHVAFSGYSVYGESREARSHLYHAKTSTFVNQMRLCMQKHGDIFQSMSRTAYSCNIMCLFSHARIVHTHRAVLIAAPYTHPRCSDDYVCRQSSFDTSSSTSTTTRCTTTLPTGPTQTTIYGGKTFLCIFILT